ncbi:MAG: ATP-binding protein [Thermodesulfobacteriota bacterium]
MIKREINIDQLLEKNKVLIIYGPRQVGKTTLVEDFLSTTALDYKFFTGDQLDFAHDFGSSDLKLIRKIVGNTELLVIDEAQKIENIGRALKLVVDNIKNIFVIATGSSSFDLASATAEPLTGRKNVVNLYPISLLELSSSHTPYELDKNLEDYMLYGMYPNVLTYENFDQKINRITEIKDSYLIKDIFEFQKVRNSKVIIDLLKLLAFQIGSEVSTLELGNSLGADNKTVLRYLHLLEKSFVLFRLDGFSRNLRKEVSKMSKYYFYDLGIRNALISNFNDLNTRNDKGQLWENFIFMERIKRNAYKKVSANYYFWRTYDKKEIDLIEERAEKLHGYEFKWKKGKGAAPKDWLGTYKNATYEIITTENYSEFVL